jgi:hypothetical protein
MEIPRLQWDHSSVAGYIANGKPVVLLDCPLSTPAANRWTTEYLNSIVSKSFPVAYSHLILYDFLIGMTKRDIISQIQLKNMIIVFKNLSKYFMAK